MSSRTVSQYSTGLYLVMAIIGTLAGIAAIPLTISQISSRIAPFSSMQATAIVVVLSALIIGVLFSARQEQQALRLHQQ